MDGNYEQHLRALYASISAGDTRDDLAVFWHRDAEQIEYPSVMQPTGQRRELTQILDGSEVGARVVRDQHYDVHTVIQHGDQVAVQLTWTATAAADLGKIAAGTPLVAHVAAFYVFRDGLILRQSTYDCYDPTAA